VQRLKASILACVAQLRGRSQHPSQQPESEAVVAAKATRRAKSKKRRRAQRAADDDASLDAAVAVYEADLEQLQQMGYKRKAAEAALDRCGGCLERALELLLSGRA